LEVTLGVLAAAPVDESGRSALVHSAVAVRDLVHTHLGHEEPILARERKPLNRAFDGDAPVRP
jgi:hypothetical protein